MRPILRPMNALAALASPLLLAALVGLGGCTTDPGNITIPFSIGSSAVTCETADVATVEMKLVQISEEGSESPLEYEGSAPCTDGEVTFNGIAVGDYDVTAYAISSEGLTVFDNLGPTSLKKVEVLEGQTVTSGEVRLTPSPARILIRWELTKGGAQVQCSGVETKQFKVRAFTDNGIEDLLDAEAIACDAQPAESPFHVVADPNRTLDGTRVDTIDVIAQDGGGTTVGTPASITLDPPGRGALIKIVLTCIDDECTAALTE